MPEPLKICLVVDVPEKGCEYHRQLVPHEHLGYFHKDDYSITRINNLDWETAPPELLKQLGTTESVSRKEFLQQFDCVTFSRNISLINKSDPIIQDLREAGCAIVFDIDDYWVLTPNHIMFRDYIRTDTKQEVIKCLEQSDYITTTTDYLAERISNYNQSVEILPNAINTHETQWQQSGTETGYTRFGWVGSICHKEDINLMEDGIKRVWSDASLTGRFQMVLAGFALGEQIVQSVPQMDGSVKTNFINKDPEHQTHVGFEKVFTNYYCFKARLPMYTAWLHAFTPPPPDMDVTTKAYRRIWATDTFNYGTFYNQWDVSIIPLNDNLFNRCKSQLKIIESGFMGKAAICSDLVPYTIDIKHMDNGWMVKHGDKKGWYKAIKAMINDPAMRRELAHNLEAYVRARYDIAVVNEKRHQFYQKIRNEKTSQKEEASSERISISA